MARPDQRVVEAARTVAAMPAGPPTNPALVAAAWIALGIPLGWGVWNTLRKAAALFR